MTRGILAVLLLVVVSGCASAAPQVAKLEAFVASDVQRGLEIASASNDPAGVACATAILAALPAQQAMILAPSGAFSTFMLAREARRNFTAGPPENVHNLCAALILDAEVTLAKLGLIAVPGGSAIGNILRP